MNATAEDRNDAAADFLKSWSESFSRILQAACTFTPDTMPPEMVRQIRAGIFEALAKAWEEFMRSPQFLQGMKQMMDNAVAFRKMTDDFLTRARQETQGTSRNDVDSILLAVRELEAHLTRRVDELAAQVRQLETRPHPHPAPASAAPAATKARSAPRKMSRPKKSRRPGK